MDAGFEQVGAQGEVGGQADGVADVIRLRVGSLALKEKVNPESDGHKHERAHDCDRDWATAVDTASSCSLPSAEPARHEPTAGGEQEEEDGDEDPGPAGHKGNRAARLRPN